MTPPRQCFWIPPEQFDANGWIPSLVMEGQSGHWPLRGSGTGAAPWYWGKTLAEAERIAATENARMGLSADDVAAILLSSLAAQKAEEAAEEGDDCPPGSLGRGALPEPGNPDTARHWRRGTATRLTTPCAPHSFTGPEHDGCPR